LTDQKKIRLNKKWTITIFLLAFMLILAFYPSPEQTPIKYIDRESVTIKTEKVASEKWLVWLYNNPVGEATLWTLVKRKFISSIYGEMMDRPASAEKIEPFVDEFDIDMNEAQKHQFNSFNDFFTRELKKSVRPVDTGLMVVISPADGKILAYADISNTDFIIKGFRFNVQSFLNDSSLSNKYTNGSLVIIRLAPNDYHRFHFPVNGTITPVTKIEGDYYSVNPIALREMTDVFWLNKREYVIISNPIFGEVIMAEVGATMVGSIVQTFTSDIAIKGQEKGYFEFGGSTVVLIFEKGKIRIDEDLLSNSANGLETSVKMGNKIGSAK